MRTKCKIYPLLPSYPYISWCLELTSMLQVLKLLSESRHSEVAKTRSLGKSVSETVFPKAYKEKSVNGVYQPKQDYVNP